MKPDQEELQEALSNAYRVNEQAVLENKESRLLLAGIRTLLEATSPQSMYERLFTILGEIIPYESAFVLEQHAPGIMKCTLGTATNFIGSEWQVDAVLKRTIAGGPCAVYSLARQPAWSRHLDTLGANLSSALYCPFIGPGMNAILVFCHSEKGFYIQPHVQMAEKYRSFTEQTLLSVNAKLQALESQKLLEEKERTEAVLLQTEKMASLGLLSAGVAHEINNPIGFISSNISFLADSVADLHHLKVHFEELINLGKSSEDKAMVEKSQGIDNWYQGVGFDNTFSDINELVGDCQDGLARVKGIIGGLQNFARRDDETTIDVDINHCVESTLKLVSNELRYHCDLQVELGMTKKIQTNEGKMNQVLTNLLVNAGHAIDDRGWIKIVTGTDNHEILGLCTWFSVEDSGCGIEPEKINRVFEPFYTTKGIGEGTGLGLAISYSIIEKLGGLLEVSSKLNLGTKFTAFIPLSR